MISALLPSRGRPDSLRRCVASLRDRAANPAALEVLVALDADDVESLPVAERVAEVVWVSDRRHGYANLHRYFNVLADAARGDWLLLWNDDAVMETDAWDRAIEELPPAVLVADLWSAHSPDLVTFPAVRREAVSAIGSFSPHNSHCDTYWQYLGRGTGTARTLTDVHVRHDRANITGGHRDRTWEDQWADASHVADFYSPTVQALIAADVEKIRVLAGERR